ncbi:MAG: sulfatase-like hydrolase/transferase [Betaproteobacteria bacterium]
MSPRNLLFILSDQHDHEVLGCAGHGVVKTPNIDRLAREGTRFTNAITPCPLCVPARASLATGRYVHQVRFWDNASPYDGSVRSWAHRLRALGHRVAAIGKLHYRSDADDNGFSESFRNLHVLDALGDILGLVRKDAPERGGARKYAREIGPRESTYTKYDREIAGLAVDWLRARASAPDRKPWMLFVGFVMPHFPLYAPPEFYRLYPLESVPPPRLNSPAERISHPFLLEMERVLPYDRYFTDQTRKIAIASYFGMVSLLDHHIGQLMQTLAETGLDRTTRVIYTSDHGEMLGNHGMWGKMCFYQESVAVPLIMKGEGVPAARVEDSPVSLLDFYPTFLEAVGAEPDAEERLLPGRSLFATLRDPDPDPGRIQFSEYHAAAAVTGAYMLRSGRWKYVHYVSMAPQLFDLHSDPYESSDLGESPSHAGVRTELEKALRKVVDTERTSEQAFADQAVKIERHGGRDEILNRGDYGYSPPPGEKPEFEWVPSRR